MKAQENIQSIYSLTPLQEGILFHWVKERNSTAYFEQVAITVSEEIDSQAFETSFNLLIRKYDILRTIFIYDKVKKPMQIVLKDRFCPVYSEDLTGLEPGKREKYLEEFKQSDRSNGFDLTKGPLIRVSILKAEEKKYFLVWSFHHIIMDGWCSEIIFHDFLDMYQQVKIGGNLEIKPAVPFGTYVKWLEKQDKEAGLKYWRQYLDGYTQQATLPRMKKHMPEEGYRVEEYRFSIRESLTDGLLKLVKKNQVTNAVLFQTLWGILLQRYNYSHDVVFASVVSGRPPEIDGIERMVGLFINTIPVRIKIENSPVFREVLLQTLQDSILANAYQHIPLVDIQANSSLKDKLIDIVTSYQDAPHANTSNINRDQDKTTDKKTGASIEGTELFEQTNYNFNCIMRLSGQCFTIRFSYNSLVYEREFVERIGTHFHSLINQVVENPSIDIREIELLQEEEKELLLVRFNLTRQDYPHDKLIHELVAEQVQKTPDNIALVGQNPGPDARFVNCPISVTYRELRQKSHELANFLIAKGLNREEPVGILMSAIVARPIAVLGVIKAGGVYIPIDPLLPPERIKYIINDANIGIIISENSQVKTLNRLQSECKRFHSYLCMDRIDIDRDEETEPAIAGKTTINGAYIIYTSGTTGKPKGVMVNHQSLVNICWWHNRYYHVTPAEHAALFVGFGFDVSVWEIFPYLIIGASLYVVSDSLKLDPARLNNYFERFGITICFFPTQFYQQFCHFKNRSLRVLLTGGDILRAVIPGGYPVYNNYGPTENTVVTTAYLVEKTEANIPIGKPIDNHCVYILNKAGTRLQPVSVPGELCISGAGLARGYLNNPDLTVERFAKSPIYAGFIRKAREAAPGQEKACPQKTSSLLTIYHTGDLARWLPDGNIEFLGRFDQQVKIRGYRIELEEIETHLLNHPDIKEAVVVAKENNRDRGDKYLCAYIVSPLAIDWLELRDYLAQKLPNYMVPAYMVKLREVPLTPNGKVNRNALPEPAAAVQTKTDYTPPGNETEKILVQIWAEILEQENNTIGIDDDFFACGGHSLKAMTMAAKIHKQLHVSIPLTEIFTAPTVRELSLYIDRSKKSRYEDIKPAEKKDYYPQSSAQKRLFFLDHYEDIGISYNLPTVFQLEGRLDRERFLKASHTLIARQDALRTSFHMIDNKPVQRVHDNVNFEIKFHSSALEEKESSVDSAVKDRIKRFVRPFNLARAPLLRIEIILLPAPDKYCLALFDMHHIINDGTSMGILMDEFLRIYEGETLAPLSIQYKDFSIWQKHLNESGEIKKQQEFWLNLYADVNQIPRLNFPVDFPRPKVFDFSGNQYRFKLGVPDFLKFKELTLNLGVTIYMNLLAVLNTLLYKYTGQEDIIIGCGTAGRFRSDLTKIIGMFVNALAIRTHLHGEKTYLGFLTDVQQMCIQAFENQDVQFEVLAEQLNLIRDPSRNLLFDVGYVHQNYEKPGNVLKDIKVSPYSYENHMAKYDLTLYTSEVGEEIYFILEYCTALFKRETIVRLADHLLYIIKTVSHRPHLQLQSIDMLSEKERKMILLEFNDTRRDYPKHLTLHQQFEQQVEKSADFTALIYNDRVLTYKELNEKANRLAWLLRDKGLCADEIVGIKMERSLEMIIGIFAVLKAGGAYLPIDPQYPRQRWAYMLKESNTKFLVSDENHLPPAENHFCGETILFPLPACETWKNENPPNINVPSNLAYAIYTSGSTGIPKGVLISHQNVFAYLYTSHQYYRLTPEDTRTQQSSFSFDQFVEEVYLILFEGGKLLILQKYDLQDIDELRLVLRKNRVTLFSAPPTIMNEVNKYPLEPSIKRIIIGGEAAKKEHIDNILSRVPVYNFYGPTETTVCATIYKCCPGIEGNIPIGKANANYQVYILDRGYQPTPVNVPGEIYISGDGVGRGFLNNQELTCETFIDNPFIPGARMFKTGDQGKFFPDGNIEYLGRIDNQVKIRGYRIELGEIESQLLKHDLIKEAAVIIRESDHNAGELFTAAFYAAAEQLSIQEIREFLSRRLPDYMIPAFFIHLEHLPLTTNNKIDKKALAEIPINLEQDNTPPQNAVQEKLVEIWKKILGKIDFGINSNFFTIGGDSIKIIQVFAAMKQVGYYTDIRDLFKYPTISELSRIIKKVERAPDQAVVSGIIPLTPIQKWFFESNFKDQHHFNHSVMLYEKEGFDIEALDAVFRKIQEHHDTLRMTFKRENGEIIQYNHGLEYPFSLEEFDLKNHSRPLEAMEAEANHMQTGINLEKGPIMKLGLFRLTDGDRLIIVIHHLVMDGVSWRILFDHIHHLFRQYKNGESLSLPLKSDSYKLWSETLSQYARSPLLLKELPFWQEIDSTKIPEIKPDFEEKENFLRDALHCSFQLSKTETRQLLTQVKVNLGPETGINHILVTALGLSIKKIFGQNRILIALQGHGREHILEDMDISLTLGWFTAEYPVILDINPEHHLARQVNAVKEKLQAVPNKGIGYGILNYLTPAPLKQNMIFKSKPQVSFNYLGQIDTDIKQAIPGLPGNMVSKNVQRQYALDVICIIVNNRLSMDIIYNKKQFRSETIQAVSHGCKSELQRLISVCSGLNTGPLN